MLLLYNSGEMETVYAQKPVCMSVNPNVYSSFIHNHPKL